MADILDGLGAYVPRRYFAEIGKIYKIPQVVYGDQLKEARIGGTVTLRSSDAIEEKQLNGYTEVISDWHTQLCLVTVRN